MDKKKTISSNKYINKKNRNQNINKQIFKANCYKRNNKYNIYIKELNKKIIFQKMIKTA